VRQEGSLRLQDPAAIQTMTGFVSSVLFADGSLWIPSRAALAIPAGPSAEQPPGERLLRTWATLGDQLERQLATELGKDRARQLRTSPQAGWMNRFSEAGCRTDSPRPTN